MRRIASHHKVKRRTSIYIMRLHGFTGNDIKEKFSSFVTTPPGLYFYRDIGVALFTWLELRDAVGFDFGQKPVTAHYSTIEKFLHHEMPTFDMTEPSEEEFCNPIKRAKAWKRKKEAARRKFYTDIEKLASVGLAWRDENGDVHLCMGIRVAEIEADRARRKAKRAHRRGESTAIEIVTPGPIKAVPQALPISKATDIDMRQEKIQTDVASVPMMDEATRRARTFNQRQIEKQAYKEEAGLRAWEERNRREEEQQAEKKEKPASAPYKPLSDHKDQAQHLEQEPTDFFALFGRYAEDEEEETEVSESELVTPGLSDEDWPDELVGVSSDDDREIW